MKALAAIFVVAAIVSAIGAPTLPLWFAESGLILTAGTVLILTYPRFQFTAVTYVALLAFALIVFTGAHYTYARVPLGEWMRSAFGFERNHFDRIGHLFQGVGPALFIRELLIRRASLRRGAALFWIVCGLCLGMAAMFELLEWRFALLKHGPRVEDLGAQGDPWDAQADMLMALIGAAVAQLMLGRSQDRAIRLPEAPRA